MNDLLRNGSGYVDITAYKALKNVERNVNSMEFKRGELFEYEQLNKGEVRKALIVSADFRANDNYLNVILLTEEPKGKINVPITTNSGIMYADCGMVSFALNNRIGEYLQRVTDTEMKKIDEGIAKCLGIEPKTVKELVEKVVERPVAAENFDSMKALIEAQTKAAIYKDMYEKLLKQSIG